VIRKKACPRPQIFTWLQQTGNVAEDEMFRVFNCGIGMVVCVPADKVATAQMLLKREGELAYEIGRVEASSAAEPECIIE
jgi:phosphoribosylformylglycinamidine cyclo-ligase